MGKKIWLKTYNFLINSKTFHENFSLMQESLSKIYEKSILIKRSDKIFELNRWRDKGVYTDTEFNDLMNIYTNWKGPTEEELMQSVVICSLENNRKVNKSILEYLP